MHKDRVIIVPKTYSIQAWTTDDGIIIDKNRDCPDYTINDNITLLVNCSTDLNGTKAIAISEITGMASEAYSRNPSLEKQYKEIVDNAYTQLDSINNGYQALAIGEATKSVIKWVSFNPSMLNELTTILNDAYSQITTLATDGRCLGIGIAASKAGEAVGNSPETKDFIMADMLPIIYKTVKDATSPIIGYVAGYIGGYANLGVSHNIEAGEDIIKTYNAAINHLNSADDYYETIAISKSAAIAVRDIGYNFGAHDLLFSLSNTIYTMLHDLPNDGRVEGITIAAEGAYESTIWNPALESLQKYSKILLIINDAIKQANTSGQWRALGRVGADTIVSVGKNPSLEEIILSKLNDDIDKILNIDK